MLKRKHWVLPLSLILLLIIPCLSWAWSGKVIGIADGDTITVLRDKEQVRIRLYGIDCPEAGQAFGKKAKQFTSKMVYGKMEESFCGSHYWIGLWRRVQKIVSRG